MKDIGRIIKNKRLAMGLSRDRLAWKTGVTPKSIVTIEGGGLPSTRTLFKICDALDLEVRIVEKCEPRKLNDEELSKIAESIVEALLNGYKNVLVDIDDKTDIEVFFEVDIKQYQENGRESGTGAWIVDDCRVKITRLEVYADDEDIDTPDLDALATMVEDKIMEG